MSLADVLVFFTRASDIPPLGFPVLASLSFDVSAVYPTASTCALRLVLPTKYSADYSNFKSKMVQALTCHGGFGWV